MRLPICWAKEIVQWFWVGLLLAGCQPVAQQAAEDGASTTMLAGPAVQRTEQNSGQNNLQNEEPLYAEDQMPTLSYHQPDGNRIVWDKGNLPTYRPVDVALPGRPEWIGALPRRDGLLWIAILADGTAQAFTFTEGVAQFVAQEFAPLPPGMPPLFVVRNGEPHVVLPEPDFARFTHPVLFGSELERMAYTNTQGELVVRQSERTTTLAVNALPDARILVDEQARLLLFTDPTDRYGHGVLGDALEAGSITRVETEPIARVETVIVLPSPDVAEGMAPIWTDLDGDGSREIVVTLSNSARGARVVAFSETGEIVAEGPAIGQGSRWRHQIGAAPLGPNGEIELVDVLTPHLGGVVEFYQWQSNELVIVARQPGYTSHVLGSRNLDMAALGDFDGDDRLEILLPSQDRRLLGAIQHRDEGATVLWNVEIGGQMVTNLAIATFPDGSLAIGVGRSDNSVRIWQP